MRHLTILILILFNITTFSQVLEREEIFSAVKIGVDGMSEDKNQEEIYQAVESWAQSNSGVLLNDDFSIINTISSKDPKNFTLSLKCVISPLYRKTCPGVLNVLIKISIKKGRYKLAVINPEYQILQKRRKDILYEKTSEYLISLITDLESKISDSNNSW